MLRYKEPWCDTHRYFSRRDIWTGVQFEDQEAFSVRERVIIKLSVVAAICAAFFYGIVGGVL